MAWCRSLELAALAWRESLVGVVVLKRPLRERALVTEVVHPDPLLQRLYRARGVRTLEDVSHDLKSLIPIAQMDGVDDAVQLLLGAREQQQSILIVGDYDADGATATALMVRALNAFGFNHVRYLVPDRQTMGYGLTPALVSVAGALVPRPDVLITVDNGISSLDGVELAQRLGMKVLITDHHLPGDRIPPAQVIVNPNLPNATFPSKSVAGVGVAFYVLAALGRALNQPTKTMTALLDLVALGTVADVVALDRNNRILVHEGLKRIRGGDCCAGIKALASVSKRSLHRLSTQDLGFFIGPRLNAAGRLDDMSIGIECLITDDETKALELAAQLHHINQERREIEASMQADAQKALERLLPDLDPQRWPAAISLFAADWHPGVVGLVASKVRERVHRPVAAFAPSEGGGVRGSVRSVPGVHIRDALVMVDTQHPGLIQSFGGHAAAAGLTLQEKDVKRFSEAFAAAVSHLASAEQLSGLLMTDGSLPPERANLDTANVLEASGPFGSGFVEPLFANRVTVADVQILGQTHLKLWVRFSANQAPIEAMCFHYLKHSTDVPAVASTVEMCFKLSVNEFRGDRRVQCLVEHLTIVEQPNRA